MSELFLEDAHKEFINTLIVDNVMIVHFQNEDIKYFIYIN